jgi:hypothetical protein
MMRYAFHIQKERSSSEYSWLERTRIPIDFGMAGSAEKHLAIWQYQVWSLTLSPPFVCYPLSQSIEVGLGPSRTNGAPSLAVAIA